MKRATLPTSLVQNATCHENSYMSNRTVRRDIVDQTLNVGPWNHLDIWAILSKIRSQVPVLTNHFPEPLDCTNSVQPID